MQVVPPIAPLKSGTYRLVNKNKGFCKNFPPCDGKWADVDLDRCKIIIYLCNQISLIITNITSTDILSNILCILRKSLVFNVL